MPIAACAPRRRLSSELTVTLVFFVSGAAGLIFEMVWLHRAGLVFGNSLWSTSIVLSTFMGGLALGNALVAWLGHRTGQLLRTYAAIEAVVAVTGITVTHLLPQLTSLLVPMLRHVEDRLWLVYSVRSVLAFAVLMLPTTAMGASLPVVVAALCGRTLGFGRVLGRLYGWNTFGAVAGVLGAELVLIPHLGIAGSAWFAGLLNLSAAAVMLAVTRRVAETRDVAIDAEHAVMPTSPLARRLLVSAFLAGVNLMALEVIWFRFLSMFVFNSTLTLSIMLAVVLVGIAAGGLMGAAWLGRRPDASAYVSAVAFTAGSVSAGSYVAFQFLTSGPPTSQWHRILWFASCLMFGTCLLSGMIFTLMGEALKHEVALETRAAGFLTLTNTAGAMCGSLVATFVLLPVLGMESSIFAITIVYCVVGVLTMARPPRWRSEPGPTLAIAAAGALVILVRFPFGLMADKYFVRAVSAYTSDGSRIVATREGPNETAFLLQEQWLGRPLYDRLVTNSFSMSGTHPTAQRYMRYFVYWPMLLHRGPLRHVLVVCYGVGVTAKAATEVDSVESIDVAETSADVIAMSDYIYPPLERPLHDPRVRLHLEDGRQFLQVTRQRFDLITGEPPPPLTPGTVNLYTREYFQLIYDRLAEGGMTTYWLPVGGGPEHGVTPIIRAFCEVFEDCSLWNGTALNWILIGTRHAQGPISETEFRRRWSGPVVQSRLREILFELPEQFGATFMADAAYLKVVTASAPVLTDNYPRRVLPVSSSPLFADSGNPAAYSAFLEVFDTDRARTAFETSPIIRHLWPDSLIKSTLPFFDQRRLINAVTATRSTQFLRHIDELDGLLTQTTLRILPLWIMGSNSVMQQAADSGDDGTGLVEYQIGVRSMVDRNYAAAAEALASSEQRGPDAPKVRALRVYALCLAGRLDDARHIAPREAPPDPDGRHFWSWMQSRFGIGPAEAPSGRGR